MKSIESYALPPGNPDKWCILKKDRKSIKPTNASVLSTLELVMGYMQKRVLINYLLIILLAEKTVQHTFVSLAFLYDIGGVRSTVAVDYRALMISGVVLAVLSAVALFALTQKKRWSLYSIALLAASDIIGEFIAQGTVLVTINISIIVAVILLSLCIFGLRIKLHPSPHPNKD